MPEVIEKKLICDKPRCGKDGRKYTIDDGERPISVILCDTHAAPVRAVMDLGQPAPLADIRTRRTRGLSPDRLRSLIVEEDD